MAIKRYWDLTEKERAALTVDEIEAFCDVEMMEKGVAPPEPPAYEPVVQFVAPTRRFYKIDFEDQQYSFTREESEFLFLTPEVAQQCIDLKPLVRTKNGPTPIKDATIRPKDVFVVEDEATATVKAAAEAAEKRNNSLRERYEREKTRAEEVVQGVWTNWHSCRELREEYARVIRTFEKYKPLAGGDEAMAAQFLADAYDYQVANDAFAWNDINLSVPEPVAAE